MVLEIFNANLKNAWRSFFISFVSRNEFADQYPLSRRAGPKSFYSNDVECMQRQFKRGLSEKVSLPEAVNHLKGLVIRQTTNAVLSVKCCLQTVVCKIYTFCLIHVWGKNTFVTIERLLVSIKIYWTYSSPSLRKIWTFTCCCRSIWMFIFWNLDLMKCVSVQNISNDFLNSG